MRFRQLDLALAVLADCERLRHGLKTSLLDHAPGLSLRFDHYSLRRAAYAFPALAEARLGGRHVAYVEGFLDAALPQVAALAADVRRTGPTLRTEQPDSAAALLLRAAETAQPDAALVEAALGIAVTLLSEYVASNLIATPNRVLTLAVPAEARAIAITLDEDVLNGWSDGHLRLALVAQQGAPQMVKLTAEPDLPTPYRLDVLASVPGSGRPRLAIGWPDDRRPTSIRLQQHGGWPSPQAQARVVALGSDTALDLNPVKTALDLLARLGQLSREDRTVRGRNDPIYCLAWQYVVKNDFVSLRGMMKAFGFENAHFAEIISAAADHNRYLPPSFQRVIGRQKFAKPLGADGFGPVIRQIATLQALIRSELGLTAFLTHTTLMACLRDGAFFEGEDSVSLALVIEAEAPTALPAFVAKLTSALGDRVGLKSGVNAGLVTSLTCTLADVADPVPIDLVVFWRDRSGQVHGVGEGARVRSFEADWFDDLAETAFYGQTFKVPRRSDGYLADLTGSHWSIQGLSHGALSSVRPEVERAIRDAGARHRHKPKIGDDGDFRLIGLRDLALDPDSDVTLLDEGRPYVRPPADLVVDLSDRGYRHDLAKPLRTPLSAVAMVRSPPGAVVRGTVLLQLPGRRLFLPKRARYDGATGTANAIIAARDPALPASTFFSGLNRKADGGLTLEDAAMRDIPGDVFWATPDEWENWGVWIVQTLPAIAYAEKTGFDGSLLCTVVSPWQRAFLEIFAPRLSRKLIPQELGVAYRIGGRLGVVAQETRTMGLTAFQRGIYAEVVERALREVAAVPDEERLFISRLTHSKSNPDYRALENEPELIDELAAHRFQAVEPERRDVLGQIALFARAREVVGLGGAGMFNLAFARAGASVLDIESSPGWVASHTNLFATSGLRFGVIFGQPLGATGPHARWTVPIQETMAQVRRFFDLGSGGRA